MHAQTLERMFDDTRSLTRLDFATSIEQLITVVLGIGLAFVLPRLSALYSAALGVGLIAALLYGGWIAYSQFGLLFDPTFPAVVLFILVTTTTVYVYRRTEQQRGEVRRAFGYYVAPAVVNEIIANPSKLELGGEVRELTLLFCDVRNFTSISERMTAHELTAFINSLLTPLSEIILDNRGTIDKYMGDAIMAFWNAPLDDADHADHAVRSALTMIGRMAALNAEWQKQAEAAGRVHARVAIGIGINSGDCCVGNLGSSQRFDYSAIGDDVNIASRFEGLSKVYGVPIVVGEPTVKRIADLKTIELDMMRVKGRAQPTRIYTAADALGLGDDRYAPLSATHDAMLAAYRSRQWEQAEAAIAECESFGVAGLSALYGVYRGRIAEWREAPPPDDWTERLRLLQSNHVSSSGGVPRRRADVTVVTRCGWRRMLGIPGDFRWDGARRDRSDCSGACRPPLPGDQTFRLRLPSADPLPARQQRYLRSSGRHPSFGAARTFHDPRISADHARPRRRHRHRGRRIHRPLPHRLGEAAGDGPHRLAIGRPRILVGDRRRSTGASRHLPGDRADPLEGGFLA